MTLRYQFCYSVPVTLNISFMQKLCNAVKIFLQLQKNMHLIEFKLIKELALCYQR